MPSLRVTLPGKGPKVYHLYKKITSIGYVSKAAVHNVHALAHVET